MTAQQIFTKTNSVRIKKIGKKSVVVLPLKTWLALEEYLENKAMEQSPTLAKRIKKARSGKKSYSFLEVMEKLGRASV